jgi:dihydropteroate synthase
MSTKISENKYNAYQVNGKTLSFEKPLIMAIVNLTPDSFYDGGRYSDSSDVLRDVEEKIR